MDFQLPKKLSDVTRQELIDVQSREFCKWLAMYSNTHGNRREACEWYLRTFEKSYGVALVKKELELVGDGATRLQERAVAPPATTLSTPWAGALVGVEMLAAGFLRLVYSASLLGRLPGALQVPFNVKVPTETAGAVYKWTAEGAGKPASSMAFDAGVTLTRLKGTAIVVFTQEFIQGINDGTVASLRATLVNGLVNFQDAAFLSTAAAVAGTSPAGALAGVVATTPGANFGASMAALQTAFFASRPAAAEPVLIAGPAKAAEIRALNGGGGVGLPILTTAAAGTKVVLIDGVAVVFADDGVEFDFSEAAAFEMVDNPAAPTATTVFRSMWQDNLRAYRIERFLNFWVQPGAVQFLA